MNFQNIIKFYRLEKNLTQKQLAEGICAQSVISKIEKEGIYPTIDIFSKIVNKLEIPSNLVLQMLNINESLESISSNSINIKKLKELSERRDLDTIELLLNNIDTTSLKSDYEKYYVQYLRIAIEKDFNIIIEKLHNLVITMNNNNYNNIEFLADIYILLAGSYLELNQYEEAEIYINKITSFLNKIDSYTFFNKYAYTASLINYYLENYQTSIDFANKGIQHSVKYGILFYLSDLLYIKSKNLYKENMFDEAYKYCLESISLFTINNNFYMLDYASKLKKKIEENL